MNELDLNKIKKINKYCLDITNSIINLDFDDFINNLMLSRGFILTLEQIGENAKLISSEFKEKYSKIPWKKIIGLRNIIAHEYDEIELDVIWNTITISIPELLAFTIEIIDEK
jgi:uncharacterized protein with HEPN domain